MSFLAPFYLLAGLAISLPIVFHMIRRTPKGRHLFSSVLFLSPSPPRVTKRSRIHDWLLLLLRALAICCLALAFARPFLRESAQAEPSPQSIRQRVLVLVDRSASMHRPGYWARAIGTLEEFLESCGPNDQVSIRTFDDSSESLITFEEWSAAPITSRASFVMEQLKQQGVGWGGTNGGTALADALEGLHGDQDEAGATRRIILISDLQSGGSWESLQGITWPEDVTVRVVDVTRRGESNASMQVLAEGSAPQEGLRVRITNLPSSTQETFHLAWKQAGEQDSSEALAERNVNSIYVAPGQSRVVIAPAVDEGESQNVLILSGDDVAFDNVRYVVPRKAREIHIRYLGDEEEPDSPEGLRFFLRPLFPDSATRTITISEGAELPPDVTPVVFIVGGSLSEEQLALLRKGIESGGQVIYVARSAEQGAGFFTLIGQPAGEVRDVVPRNYVMLGRVDLDHPAIKIFDDPRFSDFTKLKFWKYREFSSPEFQAIPGLRRLAEFEDGSPAIAEVSVGAGRVILFASGWNRSDSDLALWSKFVPLMNSLLDDIIPSLGAEQMMNVGESVSLRELGLKGDVIWGQLDETVSSHPVAEKLTFFKPGLYRFASTKEELESENAVMIAVNIPVDESRTDPFPLELLSTMGVPLDRMQHPEMSTMERAEHQRQLMNAELESRQQWWRWLLAAALGALLLETVLAAIRPRNVQTMGA